MSNSDDAEHRRAPLTMMPITEDSTSASTRPIASTNLAQGHLSDSAVSQLRECFKELDRDRSGEISTSELGRVLRSLGHNCSMRVQQELVAKVLGLRQRGSPSDPPFSHTTGVGYVEERRGQYHDAIHNQGHTVVLTSCARVFAPLSLSAF